jgi:predicted ATPase/DNA-binding winged helix-turn-helix (wHTH) protein
MPAQGGELVYESGEWEVDLAHRELRVRGVPVPLGARAFEIIEVLVQSAGETLTKNVLMSRVWPGAIVEDNTLQFHISAIRKALGADRGMLKTAPGRGYRLLGAWTVQQVSAPSQDSIDLEPSRGPAEPFQTNLPAAASNLVGRTLAVQRLRGLLSAHRVVTLTGPGGIGKTRLALEAARGLFPSFLGDVLLVELVSLSDRDLVPSAVASVLGLKLGGDQISAAAVSRAIGGKKLLLVLDNCEHVIDGAARLAEAIVLACPRTTVLATSREILQIEGECAYRVPPLDVPPLDDEEPDNILEHSAVQLFVTRTRTLRSDYSPNRDDLPAIAAICRHLDGIPLAIEFAAARSATLGLRYVASRLDDRFTLLTDGHRTALPRQQTLRATLDWSYELLPDPEKCLLNRLAVFAGGFSLEAATAVMSDTDNVASAVVDGIANLVAKSLVTYDGSEPVSRWYLLETIRTYAIEKLIEAGNLEQAERRRAEFFRDLFVTAAPGSSPQFATGEIARYAREIDNVRASIDWCFSPSGDKAIGVALTAAYAPVWLNLSLTAELAERAERALERPDSDLNLDARLRMELLIALGNSLVITLGSVERTGIVLSAALDLAESLRDLDAQVRALWTLWALHFNTGDYRAAQSAAERFSRIVSRTGDQGVVAVADRITGYTMQYLGQHREAQNCFESVLGLSIAAEARQQKAWFLYDQRVLARAILARSLWLRGFADQAKNVAQASLAEAQGTGDKLTLCFVLALAVCPVALSTGDLATAERSLTVLMETATRQSFTRYVTVGRCLEGALLIKRREFEKGSALLRSTLDAGEKTGWRGGYSGYLGILAQGIAGTGQITKALATVDQALTRADRGGERWFLAELLRAKGELLLQVTAGDQSAAEHCFSEAIEIARQQGALFWKLRGAMSIARLRIKQDRQNVALQALAPVYDEFTEGFETADLRAARTLLESLSSHCVGAGRKLPLPPV